MLQLLRGHSDDVNRFVVRDGLVVSGGRDKTLVGWRQYGGRHYEFAFAKRYIHTFVFLLYKFSFKFGSSYYVLVGSVKLKKV